MSHMGAVIKAVRRLFMNRGEMLAAQNRDPQLYQAARNFNKEIDAFEDREKERIQNGKEFAAKDHEGSPANGGGASDSFRRVTVDDL